MARTRAILTDRDREILREGPSHDRYYQVVSEVRARITENLVEDIEVLEETENSLVDELREVVCEE